MQAMPAGGQNMKKIWNMRKKDGVSPVIATILMVAITVVLAAVLYVMVMIGPPPDFKGTGNIETVKIKSNTTAEIMFGSFAGTKKPTELKVILEDSAGDRVTLSWPMAPDSESFVMTSTNPVVSAIYKDFVPISNEINPGDSIVVSGLSPGGYYEILMITIDGSKISLLGQTNFITP